MDSSSISAASSSGDSFQGGSTLEQLQKKKEEINKQITKVMTSEEYAGETKEAKLTQLQNQLMMIEMKISREKAKQKEKHEMEEESGKVGARPGAKDGHEEEDTGTAGAVEALAGTVSVTA